MCLQWGKPQNSDVIICFSLLSTVKSNFLFPYNRVLRVKGPICPTESFYLFIYLFIHVYLLFTSCIFMYLFTELFHKDFLTRQNIWNTKPIFILNISGFVAHVTVFNALMMASSRYCQYFSMAVLRHTDDGY